MKSKQEYPLVSIGIPTFNRNTGILKTLLSIWQQHYPTLEIIISDNCSLDNTQEVVLEICKDHPEIKYYRQPTNIGMIPNFEFVRSKAAGKYFMWVADDDALEPGILFEYVDFLENNPAYSLVSGEVRYWKGNTKTSFSERGFTFEDNSPGLRVIKFYFKVIFGGIIHGLMRKDLTGNVILRKVIGNDYHFIANLAYLGKVKNLHVVGYNKSFGGSSRSFEQYAREMGESKLAGIFPHIKMAMDAFKEVMFQSPVYNDLSKLSKLALALSSFSSVFLCYYVRIFPFAVGGRIKRFVIGPFKKISEKAKLA